MKKNYFWLLICVCIIGLSPAVMANHWIGGTGNNACEPMNYDNGAVTLQTDSVGVYFTMQGDAYAMRPIVGPGCSLDFFSLILGAWGSPTPGTAYFDLAGGSVKANWAIDMSCSGALAGTDSVFTMSSGILNANQINLALGTDTEALFDMTGGTVTASSISLLGAGAQFNLKGGTVETQSLGIAAGANMNIAGGSLTILGINTNVLNSIKSYLLNGRMTGYDGRGKVTVFEDVANDQIVITVASDLTLAYNPNPKSGELNVNYNTILTWTAGQGAASHHLYLSEEEEDVVNRVASAYQGQKFTPSATLSFEMELDTTYFWAVDENVKNGSGNVWSFSVANFVIIDRFDDYANDDALYNVWIDRWGPSGGVGNDSSALIELSDSFRIGTEGKSMRYRYLFEFYPGSGDALVERPFSPAYNFTYKGVTSMDIPLGFEGGVPSIVVGIGGCDTGWEGWTLTGGGGVAVIPVQVHAAVGTTDSPCQGSPAWNGGAQPILDVNGVPTGTFGWNEPQTGTFDSPVFAISLGTIKFWTVGYRNYASAGGPGGNGENSVQLIDADTQEVIREAFPPQTTANYVAAEWDVSNHVGREVFFRAKDGCSDGGFGWIGLARVEQVGYNVPPIFCELSDGTNVGRIWYDPAAFNSGALWNAFRMDLADFAAQNVNLAAVQKLTIGVDESFGLDGDMNIDNVRLYTGRCLAADEDKADEDLNGDCVVDYEDMNVLASEWLFWFNHEVEAVPVTDQPLSWWKLQDPNEGTTGIAIDSGKLGNDGTFITNDTRHLTFEESTLGMTQEVTPIAGCGVGWEGWTTTGVAWVFGDPFGGSPCPTETYNSFAGPGGESDTGTLTSPVFTVTSEYMRLYVSGAREVPGAGGANGLNQVFLKAADGTVLREAFSANAGGAYLYNEWDVRDLIGQEVYFDVVDNCSAGSYAWLAISKIEGVNYLGEGSGYALTFDDGYIQIPNESDYDFDGSHGVTFSLWAKIGAWENVWECLLVKGQSSFRIVRDQGTNGITMHYTGLFAYTGNPQIADGEWHHIAYAWDAEHNSVGCYTDGVLTRIIALDANAIAGVNNEPLLIGNDSQALDRGWDGGMTDVRIYDRCLTVNEVVGVYAEMSGVESVYIPESDYVELRSDLDENVKVDFADFAQMATKWMDDVLWP